MENYLTIEKAQAIEEDKTERYNPCRLSDKDIGLLDFESFMVSNQYGRVAISTEDEEETKVLDNVFDFYKEFGIKTEDLDNVFVASKYIDFNDETRMNVILKVNGINKRFVFEVIG